eukprot:gene10535-14153_t
MIIQIQNNNNEFEWCILEFQGEIVGDIAGELLGQIQISQDGKAEMDIGQHFLEGSVVTLKMPFLVVEKSVFITGDDHSNNNNNNNNNNSNENISLTEVPLNNKLTIEGVVRKKIIFKTRPKPIGLRKTI